MAEVLLVQKGEEQGEGRRKLQVKKVWQVGGGGGGGGRLKDYQYTKESYKTRRIR